MLQNNHQKAFIYLALSTAGFYSLLGVIFSTGKIIAFFEVLCLLPLILWAIIDRGKTLTPLLKTPIAISLAAYIAYFLVSSTWSSNPVHHGYWNMVRFSLYSFIFFAIVATMLHLSNKSQKIKIATFVLTIGSITGLYALLNFYPIQGNQLTERFYMTGRISHAIHGLYYFALVAILAFAIWIKSQNKKALVALSISAICFYMTESRGPFIALAGALAGIALLTSKKIPIKSIFIFATTTSTFFAIGLYNWGINRGSSKRLIIWESALEKINDAPIFGHGNDLLNIVYRDEYEQVHAHNIWISHLYWGGVTAAILLLICYLFLIRTFWLSRDSTLGMTGLGLTVFSLLALATYGNILVSSPGDLWFVFIIPCGMACSIELNKKMGNPNE